MPKGYKWRKVTAAEMPTIRVETVSQNDKASLAVRMGGRSITEFKRDIRKYTRYEEESIRAFQCAWNSNWNERYEKEKQIISVEDTGVDNTGELVMDARDLSPMPDYQVCFSDGTKKMIEVKTYIGFKWWKKCLFKYCSTQSCIYHHADILIVWENGCILIPTKCLIEIAKIKPSIYKWYAHTHAHMIENKLLQKWCRDGLCTYFKWSPIIQQKMRTMYFGKK